MDKPETSTYKVSVVLKRPEAVAEVKPGSKPRICMMCRTEFPSGWAGERICRKCKSSTTWRSI